MGVREFDAWIKITSGRRADNPESWEGYEQDPWWQEAHRAG